MSDPLDKQLVLVWENNTEGSVLFTFRVEAESEPQPSSSSPRIQCPNVDPCEDCNVSLFGVDNECGSTTFINVVASDPADVCRQLAGRGFDFAIKRMDRWSNPALRSDREKLEATGVTFGANTLLPVDFSEYNSCAGFVIDHAVKVSVGAEVTIELNPSAVEFDTPFTIVGGFTGGGILVDGVAAATASGGAVFSILDEPTVGGEFSELLSDKVNVLCDCAPLPQRLQMHHTLVRNNPLEDFLNRNALVFPSDIFVRYDGNSITWTETSLLTGLNGSDQTEQWNLTWSWGCSDVVGGEKATGSVSWQFGLTVVQRNLTTNKKFATRVYAVFTPEGICTSGANFSFKMEIDTDAQVVDLPRNPNTATQHFAMYDGIGLFATDSWKQNNPIFVVEITQLDQRTGFERQDIEPIFPTIERVLLQQTDSGVSIA